METTRYIIIFVTILTTVVAVSLTGLRQATAEKAKQNEEIFNKRAILSSVAPLWANRTVDDLSDQQVLSIFQDSMQQIILNSQGEALESTAEYDLAEDIDMKKEKKKSETDRVFPLFIYNYGGQEYYIVSVRGNGLWDEIWGNIAFESDLNTIVGASFDHQGETPGLGAEIKDNPAFPKSFQGKQILDGDSYVSVAVVKGGVKNPEHEVDGVSGATVTMDGVTDMLEQGIKYYLPYFDEVKATNSLQGMLIK